MSEGERKELKIKKAWWKGDNFHVVSECGEYLIFRNCHMQERRQEHFVGDDVVVQEWDFVAASRMELVNDEDEKENTTAVDDSTSER